MAPKRRVDIGIITIREDEFEAVLQRFPEPLETASYQHRRYRIRRLQLDPDRAYTIAVVRCIEQGNGEAQAAARDLLEDLHPSWLFIVGIAGGVPADEFSLGDVIVSTRIVDFSVEAVLKDHSREYALAGGPLHRNASKLAADIRAMVLDGELNNWNSPSAITAPLPPVIIADEMFYGEDSWRRDVRQKIERHFQGQPARPPLVTAGPIASSDRLIKDSEILEVWLKIARQIQAVEMESAGVYRAVQGRDVPFLAIRGISDVVGFRRHPDWTTYACHTAAAFLLAFLRTGVIVPRRSKPRPPRRKDARASSGAGSVPAPTEARDKDVPTNGNELLRESQSQKRSSEVDDLNAELQHLRTLRRKHRQELDVLELRKASFGLYAPPYIDIRFKELSSEIESLDRKLAALEASLSIQAESPPNPAAPLNPTGLLREE